MAARSPDLWIIAPVSYISSRTRLAKLASSYSAAGYTVNFAGWLRSPSDSPCDDESYVAERRTIFKGGGYSNWRLPSYYLGWTVAVLVWMLRRRPRYVHALGFESAFPVALAQAVRLPVTLIYDDADRFSLSFPMPRYIANAVACLERWTARRAAIHIIPNRFRYSDGLHCDKTIVLPNVPTSATIKAATLCNLGSRPNARLTVYVNGWLGDPRGLSTLAEVADRLDRDDGILFLAAGRISDSAGEKFRANPLVEYVGVVDQRDALALYQWADIAVTLYDPALRINRFAEANKWGDCTATGTPFIVNSEVITARDYVDGGAAFAVEYGDASALLALFRRLRDDPKLLSQARMEVSRRSRQALPFEDAFRPVLAALAASGGTQRHSNWSIGARGDGPWLEDS